jgi:excisionase family DNA binding protein
MDDRKLLTVDQLAERLSVKPLTIRRMVNRGQLVAVRIGRAVRFEPAAVDAFLATVRTGSAVTKDGIQEGRKS